jgi:hypothetical protein
MQGKYGRRQDWYKGVAENGLLDGQVNPKPCLGLQQAGDSS